MDVKSICVCALAWLGGSVVPVAAQVWDDTPAPGRADFTAQLNQQPRFDADADRAFGPALELTDQAPDRAHPFAVATRRDVWHHGAGFTDRLSLDTRGQLRRADGVPLPATFGDAAEVEVEAYDLRYVRGWEAARGRTANGLDVSFIPHAGIGVGSRGNTAEAGATLRIGGDIGDRVREGAKAFGERPRWYIYAAGSGTAVGYNFARTRDGDFTRSGMTRDEGAFLGDASIGVALRKGAMQGSFGIVYREIEAEGLRGGEGFDRDVAEGLVAFQLSIKPE